MPTIPAGEPPETSETAMYDLTPTMRRALLVAVSGDGVQWDAEDALGVTGAAFWKVLDGLRDRGLVDEDYCVTQVGWSVRRLIRRAAATQT